ncbi:EF-hand domain-containing protein [Polaromonas sp.]|jgi:Ca2+-binding EF-hand superfamily protein|uniref:EF-hand domain-containing protein n=1 Tax=Polaromonas sp. TaxID=1869339 RepID=UPI002CACD827|nr:EF-hand domain-containing protein [Polaromonas sp.]HQS30326.1 EF-hand domain-containing protein [Polaromonas sp.]HQS89689.1 EF-hand domain-containing protein [Polaromonas sp.]
MTTRNTREKRARLQRDFIPNFEIRSLLVIATFAMGAVAAHAQSGAAPFPANGQQPPVAMTAVTDTASARTVAQNGASRSQLEAAFNRADRNRDGKLSRAEAEHFPLLVERFDLIDGNHDAFLSRDEFERAAND